MKAPRFLPPSGMPCYPMLTRERDTQKPVLRDDPQLGATKNLTETLIILSMKFKKPCIKPAMYIVGSNSFGHLVFAAA